MHILNKNKGKMLNSEEEFTKNDLSKLEINRETGFSALQNLTGDPYSLLISEPSRQKLPSSPEGKHAVCDYSKWRAVKFYMKAIWKKKKILPSSKNMFCSIKQETPVNILPVEKA